MTRNCEYSPLFSQEERDEDEREGRVEAPCVPLESFIGLPVSVTRWRIPLEGVRNVEKKKHGKREGSAGTREREREKGRVAR